MRPIRRNLEEVRKNRARKKRITKDNRMRRVTCKSFQLIFVSKADSS